MRGRVLKLWYAFHLINIIFLQGLVSGGYLIYISYHTIIFYKLWNFTLNPQIFLFMNASCPSMFLLVVEVPTYQWAPSYVWWICFLPHIHQKYKDNHRYVPWCLVSLHTSQVYIHQHWVTRHSFDQMPCHTHGCLDTYHRLSVNVSSEYSIHQMLLQNKCLTLLQKPQSIDVPVSDWVNLITISLITYSKPRLCLILQPEHHSSLTAPNSVIKQTMTETTNVVINIIFLSSWWWA